ncbi:hypothetical protein [Azospirillum canadense]|uniref:hypothetical protein n=1 Tax=Azospirillum canadense TaxID=403962 RepID=UPI002227B4DA|nr:hypothetical protein [Azospirillum canadense]MCW2239514.1 hypothetical protein [Azospirillum canadense]
MDQSPKPSPDVVANYILAHYAEPNAGELTAGDVAEVLGMSVADVFDAVDHNPRVRGFAAGPYSGWDITARGGRHVVGSHSENPTPSAEVRSPTALLADRPKTV